MEVTMLEIHGTAIELVAMTMPVLEQIRERDSDLARQGRRALMSVPLNIAEGGPQMGDRRLLHYRFAIGSAREVWSVLLVAHAMKYIAEPDDTLKNKFDHVIGALHRCVHKPRK